MKLVSSFIGIMGIRLFPAALLEDMSMRRRLLPIACVILLLPAHAFAQAPAKAIANFKLKTTEGKEWALEDCKDKKAFVVAFIGTQCPVNNAYMPTLVALEKAYADKGVQVVAVNSNEHDPVGAIAEHAKKHKL